MKDCKYCIHNSVCGITDIFWRAIKKTEESFVGMTTGALYNNLLAALGKDCLGFKPKKED